MSSEFEHFLREGIEMVIARFHVQVCPECKQKYKEILKHAQEETDKNAKKMSV